jgi:predicted enzyme related to lactoylglutathione lyase
MQKQLTLGGAFLCAVLAGCASSSHTTPPPSVQLVNEVFVHDLKKSQAFYEGLGFRTKFTEKTFVAMEFGGRAYFLSERKGAPLVKPAANVRIAVPDVDRYWALAKKNGAKILTPIGDRPWKERDFLIADPDGFGLRFASLLPGGKW